MGELISGGLGGAPRGLGSLLLCFHLDCQHQREWLWDYQLLECSLAMKARSWGWSGTLPGVAVSAALLAIAMIMIIVIGVIFT